MMKLLKAFSMTLTFIKGGCSLLFLLSILGACQKNDNAPGPPRYRLKKVTETYTGVTPSETIFTYDGQGRLATMNYRLADGTYSSDLSATFVYEYNKQGSVTKATVGNHSSKYVYGFDTTGRLTNIYGYTVSPDYESQLSEAHLEYTNTKFPVRAVIIGGRLGMQRQYTYLTYTYSGDNVVQLQSRLTYNTGYDLSNTTQTYQFDTHPNPFYGFIHGNYRDPDIKTFCKNNLINSNETNTYDEQGLLTKVTERAGHYEIAYAYEAY